MSIFIFILGFNNNKNIEPYTLYQVYLDDQIIGVINDKNELYDFIDKEGTSIKEKYDVKNVKAPNGLNINKITTFNKETDNVKDVYKKIKKLKPFTILGYQFKIKKELKDSDGKTKIQTNIVNVTDDKIFKDSVTNAIESFVGVENYQKYLDGQQDEIKETGILYNSIFVEDAITVKKTSISVNEKIYTEMEDLSKYILFSNSDNKSEYTVQYGDTISKVAEKNKISTQEFLISNPEFSSIENILYPGQKVSVAYADPVIDVVVNITDISDFTSHYNVEERTSDTMVSGSSQVIQAGQNGIDRVEQNITYKNGFVTSSERKNKVVIKAPVNQIVILGTKFISGVGGQYWKWPTDSTAISSPFGWRSGAFHTAVDITNYYYAPIYAANNGVVTMATSGYGSYGIFIAINHNNGYGTGYAHLAAIAPGVQRGVAVERGQIIGYMGNTGLSFGTHLHFEVYNGATHPGYNYGLFLNPLLFY